MRQKSEPAIDPSIASEEGFTKGGQPLSYNRAPSPELAPWIGRIYVTKVIAPQDYTLHCGLFSDLACLRIQMTGAWSAQTVEGEIRSGRDALFFGPQSRRMAVTVTGSFISLGLMLRPGACTALNGLKVADYLDKVTTTDSAFGFPAERLIDMFDPEGTADEWAAVLETLVRERVEAVNGKLPDPVATRFEEISLRDPGTTVGEAARLCGVDRRRLERVASRDFGMSPKQILRRARALDMASHLRGVADVAEAEEMALRYYDESHLIHEFTDLFGMSPKQFTAAPQPIMTLALESRQARRLEALKRIEPGGARPWA